MSWMIKGFSQDFDLKTKKIQHWIICTMEDGTETRLPCLEETVQEIIRKSHSSQVDETADVPPQSVDPEDDPMAAGATEFGGEDPQPEYDQEVEENEEEPEEQAPSSEEEVPSV